MNVQIVLWRPINSSIAQLVEQMTVNHWVPGSNPTQGAKHLVWSSQGKERTVFGAIAQLRERLICIQEVVGLTPSSSTILMSRSSIG